LNPSPQDRKNSIRRAMKAALAAVTPAAAARAATAFAAVAAASTLHRTANTLLAFWPWQGELDITPFLDDWLASGRRLVLPQVAADGLSVELYQLPGRDHLQPGYQGILEPDPTRCPRVQPGAIGIVLVPGLAFDHHGTRLGRGKGHYDRLLAGLPATTRRIGVGHDFQLLTAPIAPLPAEPHDIPMQWIWTPAGEVRCTGAP
jgi:5-formyltetrahydrofolate cyclo-ligase